MFLEKEELIDLIQSRDIWHEDLLMEAFSEVVDKVLTVTERQILEHRVEGKSWKYIERLFGVKTKTLENHVNNILIKLTHSMSQRVDNLPYFYFKIKGAKKC